MRPHIPRLSVEPRQATDSGELDIILGDFSFTAYARESEADSPCLGFSEIPDLCQHASICHKGAITDEVPNARM